MITVMTYEQTVISTLREAYKRGLGPAVLREIDAFEELAKPMSLETLEELNNAIHLFRWTNGLDDATNMAIRDRQIRLVKTYTYGIDDLEGEAKARAIKDEREGEWEEDENPTDEDLIDFSRMNNTRYTKDGEFYGYNNGEVICYV